MKPVVVAACDSALLIGPAQANRESARGAWEVRWKKKNYICKKKSDCASSSCRSSLPLTDLMMELKGVSAMHRMRFAIWGKVWYQYLFT